MSNESGTPTRVHALVPAAGMGERLVADRPKQYLILGGVPILARTVQMLSRQPRISGVTVVLSPGDRFFSRLDLDGDDTRVDTTTGGETRAHSVLNGLIHVQHAHAPGWVLVHDAARPLTPANAMDRLLSEGLEHPDGAILAMPVRDTLKQGGQDGLIQSTLDRRGLWAAQTPQLFPLAALRSALERALQSGQSPTDEAQAMEHSGARPKLVKGSAANIKITWPGDLELAEALLKSGQGVD